ncbi:Pimeloyl-ACP methyl ester carboxylesterase [Nonlabens sp. Hel1_33_55]|uniref:alpha/beta fold hydrolase n=1 Tax=Nonlabens sp. Hel1_33_55 TaxID=1336802 RepID=UPI000875C516|nr:alpha/beta fold hydrolase [Nonlabens sp. Hel1_33_55]SCX96272.1 Pimeloyl-ACP methyl ester carboxylesterase [Nonlabens sp. Hel1_33_55]
MTQVYFMPGMAASPLIFENVFLPQDQFEVHLMDWIIPEPKESLASYCNRLLEQIDHENPVLIGVSFGGVIVQELAKLIKVSKLIIISSVKTHHEFPRRMRLARKTGLHKLLPTSLMGNFDQLSKYGMSIAPKKMEMYKRYLNLNDPRYLDWALDAIIQWQQEKPMEGIVHIHGSADPVFPIKYIEGCIIVDGGTHVMIINRFKWFNENLPEIIMES